MNKKKNLISALALQFCTMFSGMILPRLIIGTFGSEINGLVSSITQFLSFISLLEGGLGAVVLAELYKPIEENDDNRINEILYSCQSFFTKLSIIFLVYTFLLSAIFAIKEAGRFGAKYVITLVYIISFVTLIQYLFSITNKLLLQAEQKVYIVNTVLSVTVICNLALSIILVYTFPNIHVIKLGAALVYLIQPIAFSRFVDKKYRMRNSQKNVYKLKNRWDGFAQNLAHFVNLNTDIAVITIFLSFDKVSVYSVYLLPITALRSMIGAMTNSYQSAMGKYYAQNDVVSLVSSFEQFSKFNTIISVVLFLSCILLINPFVKIYTMGITDAEYYQPIFAFIITLANLVYCIREPYRFVILATGKFKETNKGAILEAIINLVVSIIFVRALGLTGVAIGTLCAVTYRLIYFIIYLRNNILHREYNKYIPTILKVLFMVFITAFVYFFVKMPIINIGNFIVFGFIVLISQSFAAFLILIKH